MNRLVPALRPRGFALGQASGRRISTIVVMSVAALVAGFVEGPRPGCMMGRSMPDIARLTAKKYAWEAFAEWQQAHPDRTCPATLLELNEYMNTKDIRDPWGGEYQWSCGSYAGRTSFNVWTLGEDQILGTPDDIWSYQ